MASVPAGAQLLPITDWRGLYAGVYAGAARGQTEFTGGLFLLQPPFSIQIHPTTARDTAFIGGGQIGYNHQIQQFVFGIESDVGATRLRESGIIPSNTQRPPAVDVINPVEVGWIASVRARLGITVGSVLVYGTGGVAFAGTRVHRAELRSLFGTVSETHTGWTAGAGVAVLVTDAWSLSIEYRHIDLGTHNYLLVTPTSFSSPSTNARFEIDQVTARLNWRFKGG